ncbi:thiopeptide-type bacteriocin biosynthesis protein [Kitasatospora sp. NPDC018058]|uniref:thiopeptide-type bacteriocin biosynthesis protein n=1 Tax=Kitasatospora sp. NPDC018058 TaxID=3364025 RepID=UPI0037C0AC7E
MTTATLVPERRTWLYLKLYPGRLDLLDATLTEVVAPLVEEMAPFAARWFYLRYLDGSGPHIRLRFLVEPAQADALVLQRSALMGKLAELTGGPERTALPLPPVLPAGEARSRTDVRFDLYEPEYAKWGGPRYLEVAEHAFQASSATALQLLAASDGTVEHRLALGRLVMVRLLDRLDLPRAERESFLRTHYTWWSGLKQASPADAAARDANLRAVHEQVRPAVTERSGRMAETGHSSDLITGLCTNMLIGIEKRGVHQKPLYLAFHHLHLTLNRLGIAPVEEALVSLLAGPAPEPGAATFVRNPSASPSEES